MKTLERERANLPLAPLTVYVWVCVCNKSKGQSLLVVSVIDRVVYMTLRHTTYMYKHPPTYIYIYIYTHIYVPVNMEWAEERISASVLSLPLILTGKGKFFLI